MSAHPGNIPRFIAFRVLFNARFYYPVLGVLFLDLGLTVAQYALLNVVWAVAIVALEVPSGALADVIGRRRMVVAAAALMVIEMAIFAFAPAGPLLFPLLILNRILSGAAEASASGADEALAYESLPEADRETAWAHVLVRLARWQSGAFFVAMLVGAAIYDATFVGHVAGWLGLDWHPASTTRWPLYLTLATAVPCFFVTLGLRESRPPMGALGTALRMANTNVWRGARWIAGHRRVLLLIVAGLIADSFVRLFLTFESNYFRLIDLPPASWGVLGSAMALLAYVAAPVARRLVASHGVARNFGGLWGVILVGLVGAAFATTWAGVWVIVPLGLAMSALGFFLSHYLNAWAPSDVRATVLSFRGLAFNLGYGALGLAFAGLTAHLAGPGSDPNLTLHHALAWLPPAFILCAAICALFAWRPSRSAQ
jgi:MFS family permease